MCAGQRTASVSLFGFADYTVIVTAQGRTMVRQELIQGQDCHYVRTWNGATWGVWCQQTETAMHLDVKIVGHKGIFAAWHSGGRLRHRAVRKKAQCLPPDRRRAVIHQEQRETAEKTAQKPVCAFQGRASGAREHPANGMCPSA